jgi:carbonic anhydrase/acetyltransferase-like protein (isoleucine patch superfamily)
MILSYKGILPRIAESAFVAGDADLIGEVEIGEESSVWFQAVLRGDVAPIRVGAHSNIQDGSILHGNEGMPTLLGDWVTVGHRAILHACQVEDHCLIGMGAAVLSGARVGEGSIVAAGALVPERTVIPPGSLYAGVPARLRRNLTEADRKFIDAHASHYLEYKEAYLAGMAKEPTP